MMYFYYDPILGLQYSFKEVKKRNFKSKRKGVDVNLIDERGQFDFNRKRHLNYKNKI